MLAVQILERVVHGLDNGLGSEIRAADADTYHYLGLGAQLRRLRLDGGYLLGVDRRRQVHPTQKIVALAFARVKQRIGLLRAGHHALVDRNARLGNIQFYQTHRFCDFGL